MKLPQHVTLIEVGPRDGFQFEKKPIPTDLKLEIIRGLSRAGLSRIQAASFVHPAKVPQMADADEIISQLQSPEGEGDGPVYTGLALNLKGVDRAGAAGLKAIEVSVSASETHSRKNAGLTLEAGRAQMIEMIRAAKAWRMTVRAGVQCAFGCVYEGNVPRERVISMARGFAGAGADEICLADTTGMGNPLSVDRMLEALIPVIGDIPIALHFHDTRGLGLANVTAALLRGITRFDTALGGMGGCPFVTGAAGNIATEETANLMASMGIGTGVDIERVGECTIRIEKFLGKVFPGKIHQLEKSGVNCP